MAAEPIRLKLVIDRSGAVTGMEGVVQAIVGGVDTAMKGVETRIKSSIDTSVQYASQKITTSFTTAFGAAGQAMSLFTGNMNAQFATLNATLEKTIGLAAKAGVALGSGGGGGGGAGPKSMSPDMLASIVEGLRGTGRQRDTYNAKGELAKSIEELTDRAGTSASVTYGKGGDALAVRINTARAQLLEEQTQGIEKFLKDTGSTLVSKKIISGDGISQAMQMVYRTAEGQIVNRLQDLARGIDRYRVRDAPADKESPAGSMTPEQAAAKRASAFSHASRFAQIDYQNDQAALVAAQQVEAGQVAMMAELGAVRARTIEADKLSWEQYRQLEKKAAVEEASAQEAMMRELGQVRKNAQAAYGRDDARYAQLQGNAATLGAVAGMRKTGTSMDGDGTVTSESYAKRATLFGNAETVSRNLGTGEMKRQIQEGSSSWAQFAQSVTGDGTKIQKTMTAAFNISAAPLRMVSAELSSVSSITRTIGNNMIRLSALFYSTERIGRLLRESFFGPVDAIIKATEQAHKFEGAIAGVVGGLDKARAVDDALVQSTRNLPFTIEQARNIALEMSKLSPTSSRFGLASPAGAAAQVTDFEGMIAKLQVLNPNTEIKQIIDTLRLAIEGNTRYLRQLDINPRELAQAMHVKPTDLTNNPELLMQALGQHLNTYVSNDAVAARSNLPSVQAAKIRGEIDRALQLIGEAGLFDKVVKQTQGVFEHIFDYIEHGGYRERAKGISDGMSSIFDGLLKAGAAFLQGLSGADKSANSADEVASQIESATKAIGKFAKDLPAYSKSVASELRDIGAAIGSFVDFLKKLKADNPADGLASHWVDDKMLRLDPEERERRRLELVSGQMRDLGLRGMDVHRMAVAQAPPEVPVTTQVIATIASAVVQTTAYTLKGMGLPIKFSTASSSQSTPPLEKKETGPYILDTAHMSARKGMLAEQINNALEGVAPGELSDQDAVRKILKSRIDDFEKKLAEALGKAYQEPVYHLPGDLQKQVDAAKGLNLTEGGMGGGAGFWSRQYHSAQTAIDAISPWHEQDDKVEHAYEQITSHLEALFKKFKIDPNDAKEKPDDFIGKLRDRKASVTGQIERSIVDLRAQQEADPLHFKDLQMYVVSLQSDLAEASKGFKVQEDAAVANIKKAVAESGIAYAQALKSAAPELQLILLKKIMEGTTDYDNATAKALRAKGFDINQSRDFGLQGMPNYKSTEVLQQELAALVKVLKDAQQFGGMFRPGMTTGELTHQGDMGPMSQQQLAQMAIPMLQDSLAKASIAHDYAAADYQMKATAENLTALVNSGKLIQDISEKLGKAKLEANYAGMEVAKFGESFDKALNTGITDGLDKLVEGTGNVRDAFASMARSVIHSFNQMAVSIMQNSLYTAMGMPNDQKGNPGFGGLLQSIFKIGGSGGSSGGGVMGGDVGALSPGAGDGNFEGAGFSGAAADGGIFPGGIRMFARGGIVKGGRGQLGIIGEAGRDEAVIPMHSGGVPIGMKGGRMVAILPNGRHLPTTVSMFADGGVASGGFGAFSGASHGAYAGSMGAVNAQPEIHVHVANFADRDEMAHYTIQSRGHLIVNKVFDTAKPGGTLRKVLNKQN